MKKSYLIIILLVIAGVAVASYYFLYKKPSAPELKFGNEVTITGVRSCAPNKGSGVGTMDCLSALKDDNGKYYLIKTNDVIELLGTNRIKVHGKLIPPYPRTATSSTSTPKHIDGVIVELDASADPNERIFTGTKGCVPRTTDKYGNIKPVAENCYLGIKSHNVYYGLKLKAGTVVPESEKIQVSGIFSEPDAQIKELYKINGIIEVRSIKEYKDGQ